MGRPERISDQSLQNKGGSAAVAVLVNGDGVILGGNPPRLSPGTTVVVLSDMLQPYNGAAFPDWWRDQIARARAEAAYQTVALFSAEDCDPQPVIVSIAPVPNRNEFVVSCCRSGYQETSLLNALHSIGLAISRLDLDGVLATVREKVVGLMPADGFFLALYDRESGLVHFREVIDGGHPLPNMTRPVQTGLVGWVLQNRQSLIVNDMEKDVLPVEGQHYGDEPLTRSLLIVPIIARSEVLGALSVQNYEPNGYTDEDLWLLDAVASQTAVAIYNANLYEQTASRLATLSSLQNMSVHLTGEFQQVQVADVISEAVLELLGPDEVRVYLRPELKAPLAFVIGRTANGLTNAREEPSPDSMMAQADERGTPYILSDVGDHPLVSSNFDWPPRSVAVYPIRRSGQRFGVLALLYRESHRFRQDERRTLSLMTNQFAVAVENAWYHERLVRRYEEVSALYSLAQQVTGQLDSQEILHLVVRTLREIFACRACVITLLDRASGDLVIRAADGVKVRWQESVRFKVGEGIAGQVVATGQPVYVPDVYAVPGGLIFDPDVHSILAVPIVFKRNVIGAINLDSKAVDAFSPEHERILTIAAAQVAAALENARLYQLEAERAESLVEANAELQRLEKLREELIQNLSHELRTPLTYIKGYTSLLGDGEMGEISPEQHEALDIILDKAETVQRLIGDVVMLEEINPDTLNREYVAMNQLVRQSLEAARLMHQSGHLVFELDVADEESWCFIDRNRINQAVDNLLGNAVKFTPKGGQIRLMTRLSADRQMVEISVTDSGIGIKPEYLKRIFDRFYQVKDPARKGIGGSGIGLAIVQRVVEAHGGRIGVESEYGRGSTFTIALPRLESPPDDAE